MTKLIRVLAALLVAAAFGSIAAEAPTPRSECIDIDISALGRENICLPDMEGYELFVVEEEDSSRHDAPDFWLYREVVAYYAPHELAGRALVLGVIRVNPLKWSHFLRQPAKVYSAP